MPKPDGSLYCREGAEVNCAQKQYLYKDTELQNMSQLFCCN